MKSAIYIGDNERLGGKKALIRDTDDGLVAQFDDLSMPESINWHKFDKSDFLTVEEIKEQNEFINSLYERCPDLEKDGLNEFDGYFMTYDRFLKRFETATGEKPCYGNDPLELLIDLVNERDEALENNRMDKDINNINREMQRHAIGYWGLQLGYGYLELYMVGFWDKIADLFTID